MGQTIVATGDPEASLAPQIHNYAFPPIIHVSVAQVLCGAHISNWVADKINPLGLKTHTTLIKEAEGLVQVSAHCLFLRSALWVGLRALALINRKNVSRSSSFLQQFCTHCLRN